MFGLGKKKSEDSKFVEVQNTDASDGGIFTRLKNGLSRTRSKLSDGLAEIVLGEKTIDLNLLEDIETQLLSADVGIDATDQIVNNLKQQLGRKQLAEPEQFMTALRQELTNILKAVDTPLVIQSEAKPFVILMVGVNGVGKTTSIGKLAKLYQSQGMSVMLAAGDTFRAAAVDQLQVWGRETQFPLLRRQAAQIAPRLFLMPTNLPRLRTSMY